MMAIVDACGVSLYGASARIWL